jgi:hypothetical protein
MSDGASQQLDPSDSDLLLSAKAEIDQLRRANELLAAQVGVMEFFKTVLFTEPRKSDKGMGLDVAYSLERRATALRVQGRMGGAVGDENVGMTAATYPTRAYAEPTEAAHPQGGLNAPKRML